MLRSLFLLISLSFSLAGCAPFFAGHENEVEHVTVDTAHGPVRLAMQQSGEGKPILLLHGLGTSGYTWREVMPGLARDHRVIALDLRGFGASEKPFDDRYSLLDQASIVKAFIEQENLRDLTVAGHSYGGGVTLALAMQLEKDDPRRLKRIILIDSIAYRQPIPAFFQFLRTPVLAEIGMTLIPPEVQAGQALRIAYYDRAKVPWQSVYEYASPLYSPAAKHALREAVDQIMPGNIDQFSARYKSLHIPTLLIWCDHDKIVPVDFGKRLRRDLPNAQLTTLPDCGHLPQEEQPAETLAAMRSFLSRQERPAERKELP
jgi:pimeloyl-ACP methyl ester carboxylesterase